MTSSLLFSDSSETIDAFSTLGWIGAHTVPGFDPCVNSDPVFVLLESCFNAVAQHSSNIGHKIADSLRRHRPAFCRRRRRSIGQPEDPSAVSVSDSNHEHSPSGAQKIFVVDLLAPPSYEAALTMGKPRHTAGSLYVHDQALGRQSHIQGHPPKYSVVKPTKVGVGKLCFCGEIAYNTELAPPPSYEQVVSNDAIDLEI